MVDAVLERIKEKFSLEWDDSTKMPIEIPNFGRNNLADLLRELAVSTIVEVGVRDGEYSEILAKANPDAFVYGIDPYVPHRGYRDHTRQSTFDHFYIDALARLKPYENYDLIKEFSVEASRQFPDGWLDFVYLDADHSFEALTADLAAWLPKLVSGGIIAGHDYARHNGPSKIHVVEAINGYTKAYKIRPWFVLGTKAMTDGVIRDESRSWMWVKP